MLKNLSLKTALLTLWYVALFPLENSYHCRVCSACS